jgi:hypothetical protein
MNFANLPRSLEEVLHLPQVHFIDRTLLPSESGLYFVIFEAKEQRLAYLGKAENLRMRWAGHHREPELWLLTCLGIPVDIAWIEVEKEYLERAENFLIEVFRPPLNDIHTLQTKKRRLGKNNNYNLTTPSEVLQDFRDRRLNAVELLRSDAFWEACNSEDGDLICPWVYPDGTELYSINNIEINYDNHDILPSRVPCPPAFAADDSSSIQPKDGYVATTTEKRYWLNEVAQQIDAWLVAVARYKSAQISLSAVRQTLQALSKEETIEEIFSK